VLASVWIGVVRQTLLVWTMAPVAWGTGLGLLVLCFTTGWIIMLWPERAAD